MARNFAQNVAFGSSLERPEPGCARPRQAISAWYRGGIHTVDIEDVIYLRADQKYVNVRHLGGDLLVDESLRWFEQEFPDFFLRIHRNALVARARLIGLEKQADGSTCIRLIECDDRPAVSRRHLPEVRRWLLALAAPQASD
jgi:two-component system response regulator AlgR